MHTRHCSMTNANSDNHWAHGHHHALTDGMNTPTTQPADLFHGGQDWSSCKIKMHHRQSWTLDETSRMDTNTPPPSSELLPTQLLVNNQGQLQCSSVSTQCHSKQDMHPTTFHDCVQQNHPGQLSLFHDMDMLVSEQDLQQLLE